MFHPLLTQAICGSTARYSFLVHYPPAFITLWTPRYNSLQWQYVAARSNIQIMIQPTCIYTWHVMGSWHSHGCRHLMEVEVEEVLQLIRYETGIWNSNVNIFCCQLSKACQLMANQTFPAWGWKKWMFIQRNDGPFVKLKEFQLKGCAKHVLHHWQYYAEL